MATLEKIRSHGALLLIIVGLAMLAFILGDFFNSGSTFMNRSREYIGSIEGTDIHYTDYEADKEQLTEVYKIETGRSDMNEEMQTYINNQVWQTLLIKNTLGKQAEKIGMTVTSDELAALCIGENPHQIIRQRRAFYDQTGNFNRLMLIQFLSRIDTEAQDAEQAAGLQQAKTYWNYWENAVRLTYLQEKYTALLSELVAANTLDAKFAFESRQTAANVQYVEQPYYTIADSLVKVSNSDIRSLYNKKKEQYKQEPNRSLNYIAFDILPSERDYAEVKQWINNLRNEFATVSVSELASVVNSNSDIIYDGRNFSENNIPEQYKEFAFGKNAKAGDVTDITFNNDTYAMARLIETGYNLPDSVQLRYTMLADAAQFDSLKNAWNKGEYGDASELGWLQENEMPKEMLEKAFTGAKNAIIALPYGTGVQVIQIMDKSAATPKAKLAIMERKVTPSSKTYAAIYNQAKQYIVNNNNAEKFNSAAEEENLTLYPAFGLLKNTDKVADLQQSRPIVRWAFNAKEGEVSDVFECGDKFIVALLTEVQDGDYRSIDDVTAELRRELIQDKKAEKIMADLKGITTLEEAAAKTNSEIQTADNITLASYRFGNAGMEPAVIGTAVALQKDQLSAPVKGQNGVYVLRSTAIVTTEGEYNEQQEMQQLNMRYSYSLPYQVVNLIQEKADITDNRSNFF
ncbi:MAG: SurA N-terminal domain-containing protein [Paludibacter sp.]|nr:SurA N-terminal domain-containing protein [Bacteroidales bacterium]MCM1069401.1 SurA N-terminal domain-containing protein [Prevotella sp.]MCM1353776.1 SurA N-terminal domain-containing protein [Bacteroides sp.]MCM1442823.1 SurA N-terminal domain-containing protein [Muribaculum sp.]MCM1481811.1 SurA N-terminal domain-containing protein [Paludibacter sp.]